jgi:hypothetical protein
VEASFDLAPVLGWIGLATGLATLGGGALFAVLANERFTELEAACGRFGCSPGYEGDVDAGRAFELTSWILFGAGGAFVAAAIVLFMLDGDDADIAERGTLRVSF